MLLVPPLAALAAIVLAAGAAAQTPSDRSAFEGYRAFAEQELRPWKEANDEVGRIGGWRAYAREAQGAVAEAPAAASAAQPATAPADAAAPAASSASAPAPARAARPAPARPAPKADPHAGHH